MQYRFVHRASVGGGEYVRWQLIRPLYTMYYTFSLNNINEFCEFWFFFFSPVCFFALDRDIFESACEIPAAEFVHFCDRSLPQIGTGDDRDWQT